MREQSALGAPSKRTPLSANHAKPHARWIIFKVDRNGHRQLLLQIGVHHLQIVVPPGCRTDLCRQLIGKRRSDVLAFRFHDRPMNPMRLTEGNFRQSR